MENELEKSLISTINHQKYAVGNDLVYLPTFEASFNELFKLKVYTADEIAYCEQFDQPILRYASTFAAKEAVYKAFKQVNQKPIVWKNIEIQREKVAGKPMVILQVEGFISTISLTLSHDADYVWAIAIIELEI